MATHALHADCGAAAKAKLVVQAPATLKFTEGELTRAKNLHLPDAMSNPRRSAPSPPSRRVVTLELDFQLVRGEPQDAVHPETTGCCAMMGTAASASNSADTECHPTLDSCHGNELLRNIHG